MKQQHHRKKSKVRPAPVHREGSWSQGLGVRKRLSTDSGVTLVELMIAIVIGMILIGSIYGTYISQQRSFTAQDQVAEVNSTSKVALDMLANDIRETGFGVPDDLSSVTRPGGCTGINGYTQKINWTDGGTTSTDKITILGGFRLAGYIQNAVSAGSATLNLKNSTGILDTDDRSYISIGGLSFAIVTNIGSGDILTLKSGIDKSYPPDVPVYLVENVTYQVVNRELQRIRRLAGTGCGTNHDTDVITENIEDLQFALIDVNGDGTTDRIRVNILATTARPDPNFQGQGNPPPAIENRNHAATNDSLRRRWWQMEVDLRNPI